ncbi:MAG: glycosyltransferase [Gammaproteobacteria bacterium]
MAHQRRPRVLFVAEAVTLAHVARPLALAAELDSGCREVHFACDPRSRHLLADVDCQYIPIDSISPERFGRALSRGSPVYDADTLRRYVKQDSEVLADSGADIVVGDFRLSLSVSATLAGVPYLALGNAYWSPYARQKYPVPELTITRVLGRTVAQPLFDVFRPLAFAYHAWPLNKVRREYGLPSLGPDLRRVYTCGDWNLYADIPDLVPTYDLPSNHRYLGAVPWSPPVSLPQWWEELPKDRPLIYVNLGSSGAVNVLGTVLSALSELPATVVAATAGRLSLDHVPANAWVTEFLPGQQVAAAASVVLCNGGSPAALQALAQGSPILGIPTNLDQYLNMAYMVDAGVGVALPAGRLSVPSICAAMNALLDPQGPYQQKAAWAAERLGSYRAGQMLDRLIDEVLVETVRA